MQHPKIDAVIDTIVETMRPAELLDMIAHGRESAAYADLAKKW